MKKLFVLLLISLLLVACGDIKIHENVDEDLANDSIQVIDVILNNINKDIDFDEMEEKEMSLIEKYKNKHGDVTSAYNLYNELNGSIVFYTGAIISNYEDGIPFESDKERINFMKETVEDIIITGETGD